MKHAILIIAHKNYSFLHHLIEYFERDCYVFVHIDKKSDITKEQMACLREMPQVAGVYRKYSVHWGGFSIMKTQLFLIEKAFKYNDINYFHIISGQDYPIKPFNLFLEFFNQNVGISFMSYVHLPHPKWQDNTYRRYRYFYFYDYLDQRSPKYRLRHEKVISFQEKCNIKRKIPQHFEHLYGGSQWFSINRIAAFQLVNARTKYRSFYGRLRFTFAPEETYFATVLMNALPPFSILNRNYRFIRWEYENGNRPANLGIEHFRLLLESSDFFARKMERPYCDGLITLIDKYLLHDVDFKQLLSGGWEYDGMLKYKIDKNYVELLREYLKFNCYSDGIDIGCGAGLYVDALNRYGFDFCGIDSNPYVESLSEIISGKGKSHCSLFDITKDVSSLGTYHVVMCLNVLQYLPKELIEKALSNITKLSKNSIIIALDNYEGCSELLSKVNKMFVEKGFRINQFATNYFADKAKMLNNIKVYECLI